VTGETPRQRSGWVAIAWAPYSRRSEMFAHELGGTLHCIHYLKFQSPWHAPFKYVLQAARTIQVLFRDRPAAVHVQNPPFVCALVVYLYCVLANASYVIEHHSAAFGRAWDWALPLQRFIARHAVTNIVTNEHWATLVRSWGARALVMYDPFRDLPEGEPYPLGPGFNVAFVSTFAEDEPVEAVLGAAGLLPDVHFYITGDPAKAPRAAATAPPNVTFTGFLDLNREYLGLLRGVDAVIVLTTRDYTLQLGGCEAISVGKPLVTSDWAYLRELFDGVAVYVTDSPESIRDGVAEIRERQTAISNEIPAFRELRQQEWEVRLQELRRLVPLSAPREPGGSPGRSS
jgi:glycosyltransferase involved in cell wall biosynthesis